VNRFNRDSASIQHGRKNEDKHAEFLRNVIEDLGGDPVEKVKYEFPLDTVDEFIETAGTIENTGVTAYNGR
jgi:hypothetical protein